MRSLRDVKVRGKGSSGNWRREEGGVCKLVVGCVVVTEEEQNKLLMGVGLAGGSHIRSYKPAYSNGTVQYWYSGRTVVEYTGGTC